MARPHPNPDPQDRTATHLSATEARQSEPTGHLRYMLGFGLALAVIGLLAAWIFGVF